MVIVFIERNSVDGGDIVDSGSHQNFDSLMVEKKAHKTTSLLDHYGLYDVWSTPTQYHPSTIPVLSQYHPLGLRITSGFQCTRSHPLPVLAHSTYVPRTLTFNIH